MTDSLTRVIDLKKLRDEENYRSGVIRKGVRTGTDRRRTAT